ncbi:MAG: DUF1592 domain-containing protein [Verrucomicrobiales bacterium]|nr:DUF1592 domain-containing protein [Verrucomicrobiales bacterium]
MRPLGLLLLGLTLSSPAEDYSRDILPILQQHCLDCHSTEKHKGDLDLERFQSQTDVRREPEVWQSVADQLSQGAMPPPDHHQPSAEQRDRLSQWVAQLLSDLAKDRAGDPGPVILRRLSNAEYTYTLRDLTEVPSLDPAREFPVDGAAGEGFMNTGQALVMSPSLLVKYLDAARDLANHAVLLPDGFRFDESTSRRDWTDEIVGQIRALYRRHTDARGATRVQLQGLTWDTNEGGRLPLDRYFTALIGLQTAPNSAPDRIEAAAQNAGLSPKYLRTLFHVLNEDRQSITLDAARAQLRSPSPEAPRIAEPIAEWQQALWAFRSVGHIGKVGGPKAWMEPVDPLVSQQEIRVRLTNAPVDGTVTLRLTVANAGDGSAGDVVTWRNPRLSAPGQPDLPLRDVRRVAAALTRHRSNLVATVPQYLAAVHDIEQSFNASGSTSRPVEDRAVIAQQRGLDPNLLGAWLDYLGVGPQAAVQITGLFTNRLQNVGGHDFVTGWGRPETPNLAANASDAAVRIPGNLPAHGVAIHPAPDRNVAVGWLSPVARTVRVKAIFTHAHPECGNGVTWAIELRRGPTRRRLDAGTVQGSKPAPARVIDDLRVLPGDLLSVLVGPRDGNHACDLTAIELEIAAVADAGNPESAIWNLAKDVSPRVTQANPHADSLGHDGVWHFYSEPITEIGRPDPGVPPGSLLAQWQANADGPKRTELAAALVTLLSQSPSSSTDQPSADVRLRRQLLSANGPLLRALQSRPDDESLVPNAEASTLPGLNPALFGRSPDGSVVDPHHLVLQAPTVVECRIPADLAEDRDFVATVGLHATAGPEGTAQIQAMVIDPQKPAPSVRSPDPSLPFLAAEGSAGRLRLEADFQAFRQTFPAALCYTRIVPVDEVVTLTLYHREDEPLRRLILDDAESAALDRLWMQLRFVSQDALTLVDAYAQLMEYATQDADPKVFEPLREPIRQRAAAFKQQLVEAEPRQLDALLAFAGRAYRRPLKSAESADLRALYQNLRDQELPHEEAFRTTLARILVSPAFLYRAEETPPGTSTAPVSDWELATRLSYFLWSSAPDQRLLSLAAAGRLHEPDTLASESRRLLQDPRIRRLAIEFGCQWLHIRDFDALDEKSERHFPQFLAMRGPIYEEAILFFTDFFQHNRPVSDLLDSDFLHVNRALAEYYGITNWSDADTNAWHRIEGARKLSRGGILGLAATLAKQSGASRTSPILRGNWVSEVLLGERLPRPPKDVPRLPEDEAATEGQTVRQLVERHSQDPRCAGCHVRIDPYGFALEAFDAIGRHRNRDLADRPIATKAKTADGAEFEGIDGLRQYLLIKRREAFIRQFSRKLLGYALGRAVILTDNPLLEELRTRLETPGSGIADAVETIVRSRQFREIRAKDHPVDH